MSAGSRWLRPADELIAPVVAEALAAVPDLTPADAAAKRLAACYADAIDEAATLAADAARIAGALDPDDLTGRQMLARLEKQVEQQVVLDALGPKLLAVLDALGATPKARAARKGGAGGGSNVPGKLAALRGSRTA
ncbi:hypothetical protein AB0M02_44185 [Actinoplanes sp. NPDC051861]|uniref:terminase small subunit n=1 Tax=Actinoplanes sp. NPDC051861 TaxID=3155170 RepID=UPI00342677F6